MHVNIKYFTRAVYFFYIISTRRVRNIHEHMHTFYLLFFSMSQPQDSQTRTHARAGPPTHVRVCVCVCVFHRVLQGERQASTRRERRYPGDMHGLSCTGACAHLARCFTKKTKQTNQTNRDATPRADKRQHAKSNKSLVLGNTSCFGKGTHDTATASSRSAPTDVPTEEACKVPRALSAQKKRAPCFDLGPSEITASVMANSNPKKAAIERPHAPHRARPTRQRRQPPAQGDSACHSLHMRKTTRRHSRPPATGPPPPLPLLPARARPQAETLQLTTTPGEPAQATPPRRATRALASFFAAARVSTPTQLLNLLATTYNVSLYAHLDETQRRETKRSVSRLRGRFSWQEQQHIRHVAMALPSLFCTAYTNGTLAPGIPATPFFWTGAAKVLRCKQMHIERDDYPPRNSCGHGNAEEANAVHLTATVFELPRHVLRTSRVVAVHRGWCAQEPPLTALALLSSMSSRRLAPPRTAASTAGAAHRRGAWCVSFLTESRNVYVCRERAVTGWGRILAGSICVFDSVAGAR